MPAEAAFRTIWKGHKAEFLRRGFSIRNVDGKWIISQWLAGSPGQFTLTFIGAEKLRDLEGLGKAEPATMADIPADLVLPPLPNGLEDKLLPWQKTPARQLLRALVNGKAEWGHSGAWDCSALGTGKSFEALAAGIATGKMVGVICPKSVIGSVRAKSGWLWTFAHFGQHPGFVINYELLRTGKTPFLRRVDKKRFEWQLDPEDYMLIWDEAHFLKNPSLCRSMCFAATRKGFGQLFLSGTMAATPLNLGATGVPVGLHNGTRAGYEAFLAAHGCYKKGYGFEFDKRGGPHHLAKIHRAVFPFRGARTRIEDLGDAFPETQIICEAVETDATAEIAAAFSAAQDTIDRLEKQGKNAGELKMLGQAAYMKAWHESEKAKVPSIVDVVKEEMAEGRSVALFVNFTDVREALMHALKTRCAVFGGQNIQHRNACIEDFQAGRSRVIVCNLAAGGVGVSLHDTTGEFPRTAIILPNNDAVKLGQALGRVHRAGGKSRSRQLILFARDTLEEGICNNVRGKLARMQSLNDGDLNPQPQF